jgi:hypothetical protein
MGRRRLLDIGSVHHGISHMGLQALNNWLQFTLFGYTFMYCRITKLILICRRGGVIWSSY